MVWLNVTKMRWWCETEVFNQQFNEINEFLETHCKHRLYTATLEIFDTGIHMAFPNDQIATLFKLRFS